MAVIAKAFAPTFAGFAVVFALASCNRPISDSKRLEAIRIDALELMATHSPQPPGVWKVVAKKDWPLSIAGLNPEAVTVYQWGVDISVKRYFDDGWGYDVPRRQADLPMPATCYSEPSRGVFWHGPC